MEIERKYLLDTLPALDYTDCLTIVQGYLCANPTIRIRSKISQKTGKEKLVLTIKGSGMVAREEFELLLTQEQFDELKGRVKGRIIEKKRYLYPLPDGLTAEIDVFEGCMAGLIMAEVEFEDEAKMAAFVKPDWFGEDVSSDPRYHNSYMALGPENTNNVE